MPGRGQTAHSDCFDDEFKPCREGPAEKDAFRANRTPFPFVLATSGFTMTAAAAIERVPGSKDHLPQNGHGGMVKVAIVGATGYTALELIRILLNHPQAAITALTSRQEGSPSIAAVHPSLAGRLDLVCENLTASQVAAKARFIFTALPHVAAMAIIPELLDSGCRVIDLSADYRLDDADTYQKWYGHPHTDPARLGKTVYGLPELFAERIPSADLVANPGCYTSTAILGLAPLVAGGLIDPREIIIDAKSGVSGAGRAMKPHLMYSECNESISAYGVGDHRHQPEIEQILSRYSGRKVEAAFTPHLVPMDRGILCTMYTRPLRDVGQDEILAAMRRFYEGKPFVRIVDQLPATKDVLGTNYCHITARLVRGRLIVLAVTDNLVKGAAGVAVQNFNLMNGLPETTGLPR
jgi:N-acetyl-gamma-glutamyl-phosphate reductase